VLGAITVVWAESERRYDEEDLDFMLELGRRAAYAVENARLYRELQNAVRVRDDFLSIAGHELRTPLAALQLNLQTISRVLLKQPLQDRERVEERISRTLDNVSRLDRLIDELLDVSRITSNRLKLEPSEVELGALVHEVTGRLAESAAKAGSRIDVEAPGPIVGRWDRLRLEQVVSNLVSNALKYGRGLPVRVEARLEADGAGAVLRVHDAGIGIDAVHQKRIFERFERAVSDRHYGGLGLGLWIVRQVVEASGGTISVESTPDVGSSFTVRLPLKATPAAL
jgi:signal transduction histidine kinase